MNANEVEHAKNIARDTIDEAIANSMKMREVNGQNLLDCRSMALKYDALNLIVSVRHVHRMRVAPSKRQSAT